MDRRVIAHVDADAFYASVHVLEDPSLAGKPVIVAGSGARSIVTTASYEARTFGIHSAMPAARARSLCPHGIFISPQRELYRTYSQQAMAIFRDVTDTVESVSLDEAYLDISTLEKPISAMRDAIAQVHATNGLQYSCGIGPNKLCAKVLSDHNKPAAFNVASAEQCRAGFASQSPRIIPGIGPKTVAALDEIGITTLAGLDAVSTIELERSFGRRRARELQAYARFEHSGKVGGPSKSRSQSEESTFETDISDLDELVRIARKMSHDIAGNLKAHEQKIRTIGIKVRHADFTTYTRAQTIDSFTNDEIQIGNIAESLMRANAPDQPARLVGVRVASFEDEAVAAWRRNPQLQIPGWTWPTPV